MLSSEQDSGGERNTPQHSKTNQPNNKQIKERGKEQ
jgi:hypothetical protein